jgi:cyclophilin family peptidyl-prolyl cis-trans isomerase
MRPTNRLSSQLRLEALEGREVPATIPAFWFLSSTWVGGHSQVSTPPVVTPPTTGGSGGTTSPPATPTVSLNAASHTGVTAANTTILSAITLDGTTSPKATVRLVGANRVTTADSTGAFHFTNVPVKVGANAFTVRASNVAGQTSTGITVTRDAAPTVKTALAAISLAPGASTNLDVAGTFDDADITDTKVRFDTSAGPVNVELFDRAAPKTVANFLNYVTSGAYANSIFHRSAKLPGGVPFVLQGGGFTFNATPTPSISSIPTGPAVKNEPDPVNRSNVKGTLAMAKLGGDPNSATDQFFFNLGNNAANLDSQNGGFTVFGKVVSTADQAVVDQLAAIPTKDESAAAALSGTIRSAFSEVPLSGYNGTNFPTDTTKSNYAIVNGVSIMSQPEALTYSVVGNTNPSVATVTPTNNRLAITAGQTPGSTTLTIQATDKSGATVTTTVTVTVA